MISPAKVTSKKQFVPARKRIPIRGITKYVFTVSHGWMCYLTVDSCVLEVSMSIRDSAFCGSSYGEVENESLLLLLTFKVWCDCEIFC
jgi:hypothetical protein